MAIEIAETHKIVEALVHGAIVGTSWHNYMEYAYTTAPVPVLLAQ